MNSNYFYSNIAESKENKNFLLGVQSFAEHQKQQIYVLSGPLTDRKYQYNDPSLMIVLVPKKKVAFISSKEAKDFEELYNDIIEDIGSISDKYGYKELLGRPRKWMNMLTCRFTFKEIEDINQWLNKEIAINDSSLYRKLDMLISLFIGSINDVKKIAVEEPNNLLDKIKHKIQLFDGQQTRFIYEELDTGGKRITIQGLSGTGKTELLLHKLKELYIQNEKNTFCFTCYNKILAWDLKNRIPAFFDFMKVERQIDWNRILCTSAWGNYTQVRSGVYRYICDFYEINFYNLRESGTFEFACNNAYDQIKKCIDKRGYAFTYTFIDESQDFKEAFFKLCELVTEKKVFIAGDIFQSIFVEKKKDDIHPDFLLSKCYRTDPKTLMVAKALGMGLLEDKKLWWLDKEQWQQCGYNVEMEGRKYILTREPLRRFEDVDPDFDSLKICTTENVTTCIVKLFENIKEEFPTIHQDDIAIIFLDTENYIYEYAESIKNNIAKYLGWECNIAYESKKKERDRILISNRNNVKGLEYPFVICITKKFLRDKSYRNTIYTMLTRSFIRSYLIFPKENNGLTENIINKTKEIMQKKKVEVFEPTEEEQKEIKAWLQTGKRALSLEDKLEEIFKELKCSNSDMKNEIRSVFKSLPPNVGKEKLCELVKKYICIYEGNIS